MLYDTFLHEQLNRAVPIEVHDQAALDDPAAVLLVDAAAVLVRAGVPLWGGGSPAGAGLEAVEEDGRRVVRVAWGMSDDADYRTVGVMLGAVAEVLRIHGFAVERHPVGAAYLITGRA
jgi:hypothetical protein